MTGEPHPEIELAFLLSDAAARRLATTVLAQAPPVTLQATYYDTPDLALRAHYFALRVRREGGRWRQTLKSGRPGSLIRSEWEWDLPDRSLKPDLLDAIELPDAVRAKLDRLRPQFEIDVKRRSRVVASQSAEIEVALDEGLVIASRRRVRLLEVEFELKKGAPADLFALARKYAADGGLRLTLVNKSDRGFALAAGPATVLDRGDPSLHLEPDLSAGAAIAALGAAALQQLCRNLEHLDGRPDRRALHNALLGAERLTALFSVSRAVLGERARAAAPELRWLMARLADAAALDDLISHGFRPFVREAQDRPATALFGMALLRARRATYHRAREAVMSDRVGRLLLALAEAVSSPKMTRPAAIGPIADFARACLSRQVFALGTQVAARAASAATDLPGLRRRALTLSHLSAALEPVLAPAERMSRTRRAALDRLVAELRELAAVAEAPSVASRAVQLGSFPDPALGVRVSVASGALILLRLGRSKIAARRVQQALTALTGLAE